MTQTHGSGDGPADSSPGPRPPRVVLFRANAIESDSRAKKLSLTLARLGYDVHVLSAEEKGPGAAGAAPDRWLGPVRVHTVLLTHSVRDVRRLILGARRRRQFRVIDWTPTDEYVTQVAELKQRARDTRALADELRVAGRAAGPAGLRQLRWVWARLQHEAVVGRVIARKSRWRVQWAVNVAYRIGWRTWDARREQSAFLVTTRGMLPEVEDYAASFGKVLDDLEPDVIHAHHPLVLGTAVRAARRRRAAGAGCVVVYDARENFPGIPKQEQGNVRRHAALVREEARYIREAGAVVTVSEPIADVLQQRYRLPARPAVVLNAPILGPRATGPTVRDAAGLGPGVPLVVYGGAVSRARGVDTLIEALALLPDAQTPGGGVHAVVVPVPYPHPLTPELLARASELGVAHRVHFVPPVGQDRLLHYLSGADAGVMPLRTGSANIEQALPNKLFENLHAGLTLVTSDAALMKRFVTEHDLGEVYHDPDPADLAAAIGRALANPRDAQSPERAALVRRYSWQGQEPVIRDLYRSIAPAPCPGGIDDEHFGSLTVTTELPPPSPVPVVSHPPQQAAGLRRPGRPGSADSGKPEQSAVAGRYRVPGDRVVQCDPASPSSTTTS